MQPSLIPIDTHVSAIAARHPAFPVRLRKKPMSKLVYEETQAFLADAWGPLGGWCQAVLFAADLPKARVATLDEQVGHGEVQVIRPAVSTASADAVEIGQEVKEENLPNAGKRKLRSTTAERMRKR
jgi:hypothetical protein